MRAAIAAEAAGTPSVSIVCEGFERQALATGRGLGFDGLRLAVLQGHVDTQSSETMLASFISSTVDEVIRGLTESVILESAGVVEPAATQIVASGTLDEIQNLFVDRGWSDGSPVVPPTRDRVEAMLAHSGHDAWKILGLARPSGRDITLWSIAVNAVMAGVRPEQFPVLVAIAEALADPHYGVEHSGNTTGADALVIVSGPSIASLGFNSTAGALRDGTQANTSIGRWLRLFLRNVCGFTIDQHDKATFGNSSRVVLAEHHETLRAIGWPTTAEEFGHHKQDDAITIGRINSGMIIGSVFGSTPAEIVPYLADGLVRVTGWDLTHVFGLGRGQYRPVLVLSPLLAQTFARAGWSKNDVRNALFEQARTPAWHFEKLIGEWSNLTAGRRTLFDLAQQGEIPSVFGESDDPNRMVPIVSEPSKFLVVIAGDPNRANAYVMSNDGPHGYWTSKRIDLDYQGDLVCEVTRPGVRQDAEPAHPRAN
jgi:hypothetical protein